ncbi:magnesium and cobalt transport protein CorA [Streptomyces sp. NPDC008238]
MAQQDTDCTGLPSAVEECALYERGRRLPGHMDLNALVDRRDEQAGRFAWIGLYEPTADQIQRVADLFDLHPLAVEDAVHAHQRPKLERYGDTMFLVLKTAVYVDHEKITASSNIVETGEIMVFVGSDFAITVRHRSAPRLEDVLRQLQQNPEQLRRGPVAVMHAIADLVVDRYLDVADAFDGDIDALESEVFSPHLPVDPARIYQLKRELMQFKRAVMPLAPALQQLSEHSTSHAPDEVPAYFRDVADHHQRVSEQIITFEDLVSGILGASIAQLNVQQNADMRRISAWAALVAFPTLVVGIYGMNFDYMPELRSRYGYPAVLVLTALICTVIYRTLRRKRWL